MLQGHKDRGDESGNTKSLSANWMKGYKAADGEGRLGLKARRGAKDL